MSDGSKILFVVLLLTAVIASVTYIFLQTDPEGTPRVTQKSSESDSSLNQSGQSEISVATNQTPPVASSSIQNIKVALKLDIKFISTTEDGRKIVVDNTLAENLLQGNRLGIVRDIFHDPFEIVSIDASLPTDEIIVAKKNGEMNFTSSNFSIELSENVAQDSRQEEYLVIFYEDSNRNDRFDKGEPFISGCDGSKDTLQLQFFREVSRAELDVGIQQGWNIVEGGEPRNFTQNFDDTIFFINPAIPHIN